MRVKDTMTPDVRTIASGATLREAARAMADTDVGALPVADGDRLIGMITDRDIAIRGVAAGKGPDVTVGEVMSPKVLYCFDDEDVIDVAENMSDQQVRRLPVLNREKRLIGIVSLADIAGARTAEAGEALEGITRPGGAHSQSVTDRLT
ncbi:MAG: CBS domain-containing protein [Hyphomonadaceae bacterium]